jgi:hypothetical protein
MQMLPKEREPRISRPTSRLRAVILRPQVRCDPGVDGLTWRDDAAEHDHRAPIGHRCFAASIFRKRMGRRRPLAIVALDRKITPRATVTAPEAISRINYGLY